MKVLALCAGLALSSMAVAQDPIAEFVPASEVRQLGPENFSGVIRPSGDVLPAAQSTVYNNQSHTTYYTTTTVSNIAMDDIALMPGATHTYPLLITAMNFAFQVKTLAGGTFDMEVTFYDTVTPTAAAGTAVNATSTPIVTFLVPVTGIAATGVWTTGSVSLAALPGGGVSIPDGGCFTMVRFLQTGTQNLMAGTDVGCAFQSGIVATAPNWASTKPMGSSHNGMWLNFDNDTIPLEAADRAGFAYPAALDWAIKMEITVEDVPPACPADFNGDTVVDFFDYLDFVDQFSIGCP